MESESPILNMRKSNKSHGQGAKEGQRHSPTPTGPWQIPPTPTSFSQVSVGFAGAVLLLDAIRHKH